MVSQCQSATPSGSGWWIWISISRETLFWAYGYCHYFVQNLFAGRFVFYAPSCDIKPLMLTTDQHATANSHFLSGSFDIPSADPHLFCADTITQIYYITSAFHLNIRILLLQVQRGFDGFVLASLNPGLCLSK